MVFMNNKSANTTSFAFVPNTVNCLVEFRMSFGGSFTPRALFRVRIVFTLALKSAVRSMFTQTQNNDVTDT